MRILLRGYYRLGNTGDDCLLAVMLHYLDRWFPGAQVLISPLGDVQLPAVSLQCSAAGTGLRTLAAICRSDLVIFGGGGVLQDYGPTRSDLDRQLNICRIAHLLRRPVAFLGIGVGPLARASSRRLVSRILRLADVVLLRDRLSAALLDELAFGLEYAVGPDPALLLPEVRLPQAPAAAPTGGTVLGVSLLPFFAVAHHQPARDERIYELLASALDSLLAGGRVDAVRLFCLHAGADYDHAAAQAVRSRMAQAERACVVPYLRNPYDVFTAIGRCTHFLGLRLHAALLAYAAGVPFIAVEYHPKVAGFADMIQLPAAARLPLADLELPALEAALERLLAGDMPGPGIAYPQICAQARQVMDQVGEHILRTVHS